MLTPSIGFCSTPLTTSGSAMPAASRIVGTRSSRGGTGPALPRRRCHAARRRPAVARPTEVGAGPVSSTGTGRRGPRPRRVEVVLAPGDPKSSMCASSHSGSSGSPFWKEGDLHAPCSVPRRSRRPSGRRRRVVPAWPSSSRASTRRQPGVGSARKPRRPPSAGNQLVAVRVVPPTRDAARPGGRGRCPCRIIPEFLADVDPLPERVPARRRTDRGTTRSDPASRGPARTSAPGAGTGRTACRCARLLAIRVHSIVRSASSSRQVIVVRAPTYGSIRRPLVVSAGPLRHLAAQKFMADARRPSPVRPAVDEPPELFSHIGVTCALAEHRPVVAVRGAGFQRRVAVLRG